MVVVVVVVVVVVLLRPVMLLVLLLFFIDALFKSRPGGRVYDCGQKQKQPESKTTH